MEVIISGSHKAIYNLALEESFLTRDGSSPFLFLWQNMDCVVVGRNQNVYKECDINYAYDHKIDIARRMSGGGAVYHDLGNLNYTVFYKGEENFKNKVASYIVAALNTIGLNACFCGKNDIEIEGRKISGIAYYYGEAYSYVHGCLLIDADIERMCSVLTPDNSKINSKGIVSAGSRVANCSDLIKDISVDTVINALVNKAYLLNYDGVTDKTIDVVAVNPEGMCDSRLFELINKYKSIQWTYEKKIDMDVSFHRRFNWGNCSIHIESDCRIIKDINILTDSIETEIFEVIEHNLKNSAMSKASVLYILNDLMRYLKDQSDYGDKDERVTILGDIIKLFSEELTIHE